MGVFIMSINNCDFYYAHRHCDVLNEACTFSFDL